MKRMNLIRATLLVVCAFMGTVSLSAQVNWVTPAQARPIISAELTALSTPFTMPAPPSVPPFPGITPQQMISQLCPDCELRDIKKVFLQRTAAKIQAGLSTGDAVLAVRTTLTTGAMGKSAMLDSIQQVYLYMVAKLGS